MESSPAFDYNIIKADILTQDIKTKFNDKLTASTVLYNPPGSIILDFSFEILKGWYHIVVFWKAVSKQDRFEIGEKCWTIMTEYYGKTLDAYSDCEHVTTIMNLSNNNVLKFIGECLA